MCTCVFLQHCLDIIGNEQEGEMEEGEMREGEREEGEMEEGEMREGEREEGEWMRRREKGRGWRRRHLNEHPFTCGL